MEMPLLVQEISPARNALLLNESFQEAVPGIMLSYSCLAYLSAFSVSGENRFDLQLYKRPKSASQTFQHPGLVRVYCNIHPQMSAVVLVRDNPYFAKAAPDGSFTIEGVPAGKYTLTAWHDKAGSAAQEIVVPGHGQVAARPMSLDASGFKPIQHKNKFGKDYSTDEKY